MLHHRGRLCYDLFLKNRANSIASLQYATFILFVGLSGHNATVFVMFSEHSCAPHASSLPTDSPCSSTKALLHHACTAAFNLRQQLLFVAIAWGLDTVLTRARTATAMRCIMHRCHRSDCVAPALLDQLYLHERPLQTGLRHHTHIRW